MDFQKQHGLEMRQTFDELIKDYGLVKTWLRVLPDFFISVLIINIKDFMEKSSLQFKLALWGVAMLVPFTLLVLAAMLGTLFHFPANNFIGQHILAGHLGLAPFILIILPMGAFFMNLVPLVNNLFQQKQTSDVASLEFIRTNVLTLVVAVAGIGAAAFIPAHDAIPCFINGLIAQHFHNIVPLFDACRNA
ncbi:MAG: hypothetical protein P4L74_04505 [Candidatus Doudnabacteria bacterium]|nr:hypothetical protein [Candidatus Doudnabacteria bacterium]